MLIDVYYDVLMFRCVPLCLFWCSLIEYMLFEFIWCYLCLFMFRCV